MKYVVYATNENGQGHVQQIAEVDDITEFEIRVGMFSKDVVISFSEEKECQDNQE